VSTTATTEDIVDASGATRSSRPLPWLVAAALVFSLVAFSAGRGPIRDIDLYWHLLIGQEVLSGTAPGAAGHGWSFAPVPDTWVSTQWLAEVLFAKMEALAGLSAFPIYRVVTTIAALVVLGLVTLRRRPATVATWAFCLGAMPLYFSSQERSQQLTFILAPLVGWWAERTWREGKPPRWWVILPLVLVWSNFHGGWILAPLALGLAAVARLVDHGVHDRAWRTAALLAVGSVAVSIISPAGLGTALAAFRFANSGQQLGEWGRAAPWNPYGAALACMLVSLVLAWARGAVRPSRGELLLLLGLVAFGFGYWRNLTPAGLMLAPLLTGVLARALKLPDPLPPGGREPWARLALGVAAVGAALSVAFASVQAPVDDPDYPMTLISDIAHATSPQRVLVTYNLAGPTLWYGGRPPHVTVGIDGRSDRYGGAYIDAYTQAFQGQHDWKSFVTQLAPTSALVGRDEPVAALLIDELHWVEVGREGDYVLLRAPSAPGWG
jgi:hypothetical protein